MNLENLKTTAAINSFLDGSQSVAFTVLSTKTERYAWIKRTLIQHRYHRLSKPDKGIIIQFICKVSGYSRQQVTRLIKQYRKTGTIQHRHVINNGFIRKYTDADARLLAKIESLHPVKSGATIKKLCERAYCVHGESEYERLSTISVSHLYNLRESKAYQNKRRHFEKTKSKRSDLGVRKKPRPDGKPGYLRIDTVHQGDLDGTKGVYHINAVDEVTQFEIVASVEKISENCLIPVLEQILEQFPFGIISMHSDNGSEYINQYVVKLLNKLLIELTKSRARHSNDNALAESKNASVVRNILGYAHIPQACASLVEQFNQTAINPYVNYHRPCYFPVEATDKQGKIIKKYPYKEMKTPYEKLKSLSNAQQYLKQDVSFKVLDLLANQMTDNQAAERLNTESDKLFKLIAKQSKRLA